MNILRSRLLLLLGILVLSFSPAQAQEKSCTLLCSPTVVVGPLVSVGPLFGGADVRHLETGAVTAADPTATFEVVGAVGIPTTVPRIGLVGEVVWAPFADAESNPFTGQTAEALGVESVNNNPVTFEAELNVDLLRLKDTGGWFDLHVDIVDQLSPATQPDDRRLYTHKLNLELESAVLPFHRFDRAGYLRRVEVVVSLDYLATGLPQEGDTMGGVRFLEDASPWAFAAFLIFPIAPLAS